MGNIEEEILGKQTGCYSGVGCCSVVHRFFVSVLFYELVKKVSSLSKEILVISFCMSHSLPLFFRMNNLTLRGHLESQQFFGLLFHRSRVLSLNSVASSYKQVAHL